nr:TonB-dependent receptor [Chitinophagaceae bacterium]
KYRWYNLSSQKTDMNLYAMLDHRLSKSWSMFVDMQVRKVQYQINGFRNNPDIKHDLNFLFFNPKFSINWQYENHKLNLMIGAVQKEPNREDIEAGTENLPKPEKLFNVELKYDFKVRNYLAIFNSYLMYYKDQLILTGKINDVGAYTRTNVPKSFRAGIEVEQRISNRLHSLELAFNASFSMNQVLNFSEYIDDYDNGGQIIKKYSLTDIAFSPNTIIGGRISIFPMKIVRFKEAENFSIDLMPKYVSQQFLDNTSNAQRTIPSFFITDVVINCPILIKNHTALQARIGLYNVFNHLYESNGYTFSYFYNQQVNTQNYYFPQAGFHWLAGIGIEF